MRAWCGAWRACGFGASKERVLSCCSHTGSDAWDARAWATKGLQREVQGRQGLLHVTAALWGSGIRSKTEEGVKASPGPLRPWLSAASTQSVRVTARVVVPAG